VKSLFLFSGGRSILHRMDPRTKALIVVAVLIMLFVVDRPAYSGAVGLGVVVILHVFGRIAFWEYGGLLLLFAPLIIIFTLIQSVSYHPIGAHELGRLGPVSMTFEGAQFGLSVSTRLVTMGLTFAMLAMTTNPMDIALAVTSLGIPYRYSYLTSFALRFLPLVQDELEVLREAVAARAHPDAEARNPLKRLRVIVRTLPPLAIGTLRRSIDIALAMELRGYRSPGPRTYLRQLQFKGVDAVALAALALFLAGSWSLKILRG
jgi:energy-coupling factor transport system permease protein